MSRTLTANFVRELLAQESGEAVIILITLTHPMMTTIRLANNTVDVVSNGNTYTAFPFRLNLPADVPGEVPNLEFEISNVDRRLVDELRSITGDPIAVTMSIVAASAPDVVEIAPFDFDLVSVTYDVIMIRGILATEPILQEPFPADTFNPQDFPGMFS